MIVVDSSAVVDALSGVTGTHELRDLLATEALAAPALLDYEVVSAVRGLAFGGHLSAGRAEDLLSDFDDLAIRRWPAAHPLRLRAFQLRMNLSAYDAAYVALAESLHCPLVTRDARLASAPGHDVHVEIK